MAPQEQACQVIADGQKLAAEQILLYQDISKKVRAIIELKSKILYGIVDIGDALGAQVISAINAAAATAVTNGMVAISSTASFALQQIMSEILKIMLASPTAIYSLVAIPQEEAIRLTVQERKYLRNAKHNLDAIVRLIGKWSTGISGASYYDQMLKANPIISDAIDLGKQMIDELRFGRDIPGQEGIAFFDSEKYASM